MFAEPPVPATAPRRRGPSLLLLLALLITWTGGCKSAQKKRPGMEGYNELLRNQQMAETLEQMQRPTVYVLGPVQRPAVAWRQDFTLAEALLEAGYTNPLSPRSIRITRAGRVHTVDVRRLMRGTDNPVLEPGDRIEVVR